MDQTNDFYISLISTDSLALYPNNTTCDFSNLLAYPLNFDDVTKWQVSLCQVGYTSSVFNVESEAALTIFDFLYEWKMPGAESTYGRFYDLKILPGSYLDPQDLADQLNELTNALNIPRLMNKKLFSFDQHSKKFTLIVHDLWITMIVKKQLVNILGLQLKHYIPNQVAFIGKSKEGPSFVKNKVNYKF